jgi:hypothetical protein
VHAGPHVDVFGCSAILRAGGVEVIASASLDPALVAVTTLVRGRVVNPAGDEVGRLVDVVVRWDEEAYPALTGVVVRVGGRRAFIHADNIERLSSGLVELGSARVVLEEFERRDGEVLLVQDVLDHQLVDVTGARVVRAADLYLAVLPTGTRLVAVDVGLKALARRMLPGRRAVRAGARPDSVLDWAAVQPFSGPEGRVRLRESGARLQRLRLDQLADLLDDLGREERRSLLAQLDAEVAADVLEEAPPSRAAELLEEAAPDQAAAVLLAMEPDEAAEALREVDDETRGRLLALLAADESEHLATLVRFSARTAGGNMTSRLVVARLDDTMAEVRERLRVDPDAGEGLDAIVVVDDDGRVFDDISMLELLLADPDAQLSTLTGPPYPVVVQVDAGLGEVVERFIDQRGSSIVVVDDDGRPVGRILADDLVDALVPVLDRGERRRP